MTGGAPSVTELAEEASKTSNRVFRGYNPNIFDFLARAKTVEECEEIIEFCLKQGEIDDEIAKFHLKSDKARKSAEARWSKKTKGKQTDRRKDANALQTQSERNANQEPITNNQETIKRGKFIPPTVQEIARYCSERGNGIDPQAFLNHYQANGWVRGKTKVKDWKACVRTWEKTRKATAFTGGI